MSFLPLGDNHWLLVKAPKYENRSFRGAVALALSKGRSGSFGGYRQTFQFISCSYHGGVGNALPTHRRVRRTAFNAVRTSLAKHYGTPGNTMRGPKHHRRQDRRAWFDGGSASPSDAEMVSYQMQQFRWRPDLHPKCPEVRLYFIPFGV